MNKEARYGIQLSHLQYKYLTLNMAYNGYISNKHIPYVMVNNMLRVSHYTKSHALSRVIGKAMRYIRNVNDAMHENTKLC